MNILVTGACGQLGTEMRKFASGSNHRFIFTDVASLPGYETLSLDITDALAVERICREENVGVVVNCAAYTNVDRAEDDAATAELLNSTAPGILAGACRDCGATFIHVSTDYVFPGNGCVPLKESDTPSPVSVYGSTKLAGEKLVQESGCNYVIIRTAWLYSPYGKNFVKTMLRLTSENDSVKVVYDQVGSPTCAADLADAVMHIIDSGKLSCKGIYHFTDEGAVSWYDFARAIAEISGNDCDVRPCLSGEFPSKVNRPHYSVLDKSLIKSTFGVEVPYWRDSLSKCIRILTGK